MTNWQQSRGPHIERDDERPSVRQIIREARPESRRLVRQIYRERIEDGVRGKIARMMRDKTPWYLAERSPDERGVPW